MFLNWRDILVGKSSIINESLSSSIEEKMIEAKFYFFDMRPRVLVEVLLPKSSF